MRDTHAQCIVHEGEQFALPRPLLAPERPFGLCHHQLLPRNPVFPLAGALIGGLKSADE